MCHWWLERGVGLGVEGVGAISSIRKIVVDKIARGAEQQIMMGQLHGNANSLLFSGLHVLIVVL